MARPTKRDAATVDAWIAAHPGWERAGEDAIARRGALPDVAAARPLDLDAAEALDQRFG